MIYHYHSCAREGRNVWRDQVPRVRAHVRTVGRGRSHRLRTTTPSAECTCNHGPHDPHPIPTRASEAALPIGAPSPSSAYRSRYEHRLLTDAGGDNLFGDPEEGGSDASRQRVELSEDTLLDRAASVEVWITSGLDDQTWPAGAFLNSFQAYREGRLYHRNRPTIPGTDANNWKETGSVRPDLILADLIHPGLLPDHEPMFLGPVELTKKGAP